MSSDCTVFLPDPAAPGPDSHRPPGLPVPDALVLDVLAAVAELGSIVVGEMPMDEVLARIAQVAKGCVPGADEVSLTMVRDGPGETPASTGVLASMMDEAQYAVDAGPCLHAARTGETVVVTDMGTETRWPIFTREGVHDGALSSLSVALPPHDGTSGAFNIYGRSRHAFDEDSRQVAEYVAECAAVAMRNISLYDASTRLSEQLKLAMDSRAVIEQAKGIIMGERRCSADEAFTTLAKVSQDANRKLRDVAAALVAQARTPESA